MRLAILLSTIALTLTPVTTRAQAPPAQAPAPPPAQTPASPPQAPAAADEEIELKPGPDEPFEEPTTTTLTFGARVTGIDGDGARYERYRDLGDGLFLDGFTFGTERRGWIVDLSADHVGRRDQRFAGSAILPGRLKIWGYWDQIPMLMSRSTTTLFATTSEGVLSIDDSLQAQVQALPNTTAQAAALDAALASARPFELKSRRHWFESGVEYIATPSLTLQTNVRQMNREGNIPFGGSFGHGNVVETLAPVNHRITDLDGTAEYVEGNLLVRGGYSGSWFHNDVTSLVFDNPWRAVDAGNASSRGRLSLAPSNSFINVNGMVSYRLPYRSRASVYGSLGTLRDAGDALVPFTVNTALPIVPLDRAESEGEARTSAVNLTFTSRPTSVVDVDMRYRVYDYDNRTPEFVTVQRVAYDNAVSTVNPPVHTEPFGVRRGTFDADVRVSPIRHLSAGVGFSRHDEERVHRIFEEVNDNVIRVTVDSIGHRFFSVRTKYEHGERRGVGDPSIIAETLLSLNDQPGMRHFDIASRDRNRVTIIGSVVPIDILSFSASIAAGKDDYIASEFGLRDNQHRVYSFGADVSPIDTVRAGMSYSFENYDALSRSRQWSPTTGNVERDDPSRNWATDSSDRVHSVIAELEVLQIADRFDLAVFADYNRARGTYQYLTGPVPNRTLPEEVIIDSTLPTPARLPEQRNELFRSNVDLTYAFSERWGLGTSFWYERYSVSDFSLDAESLPRTAIPGAVLLGYRYLPYTARTFWVRAIYKF
jgi:MtrB/PioB family decaheme-associated outer membrane protein